MKYVPMLLFFLLIAYASEAAIPISQETMSEKEIVRRPVKNQSQKRYVSKIRKQFKKAFPAGGGRIGRIILGGAVMILGIWLVPVALILGILTVTLGIVLLLSGTGFFS